MSDSMEKGRRIHAALEEYFGRTDPELDIFKQGLATAAAFADAFIRNRCTIEELAKFLRELSENDLFATNMLRLAKKETR